MASIKSINGIPIVLGPSGLETHAVTNAKIANEAVSASRIGSHAVQTDKIATLAVTTEKIANGAVTDSKLQKPKVNTPLDGSGNPNNGTAGQLLRTLGNGKTEWSSVGLPTDEQIQDAVNSWFDDHPEAVPSADEYTAAVQAALDAADAATAAAALMTSITNAEIDAITES